MRFHLFYIYILCLSCTRHCWSTNNPALNNWWGSWFYFDRSILSHAPVIENIIEFWQSIRVNTLFSGADDFSCAARSWTHLICNHSLISTIAFLLFKMWLNVQKFAVKSNSLWLSFCLILSHEHYFDKLLTFMIVFCVQLKLINKKVKLIKFFICWICLPVKFDHNSVENGDALLILKATDIVVFFLFRVKRSL